jgi:hypothetical protein
MADATLSCSDSNGGWADGYYNVDLSGDYSPTTDGDVTVRITNTLD